MTDPRPVPVPAASSAPYWEGAAQGRLLLPFCSDCARHFFYPRAWCPICMGRNLEWREASGRGTVHTFSIVHAAPAVGFEGQLPYVIAVIDLAEGPRMMANLVNCAAEAVRVGLPVRVVFEERGEMRVPQFEPEATV